MFRVSHNWFENQKHKSDHKLRNPTTKKHNWNLKKTQLEQQIGPKIKVKGPKLELVLAGRGGQGPGSRPSNSAQS